MAIKFDDGSTTSGGFDNVSAKNSGKNKVMYFRAPKEVDEAGNPIKASHLFYVMRLMKYSTDRREQPFIRKYEHEAWRVNAEGKREFAGRVTCLRSTYMQKELRLPHGAKARDLCPMCKYAESKMLAAKNSGDRTLYKQSFDAEAREYVYGVAYVIQDPNFKTNNGTLRVFRLSIPRVKKANRNSPWAYGICDELAANMKKRGIDVMNSDGTSKNIYDLFCEVIQKEIVKGKNAEVPYCVFNGGFGVNLGIRVKHVDVPEGVPYFGGRDMITNIVFSPTPTAINEIDPSVSGENLEKLVNALDFDGNFMSVDSIDDIKDFCARHFDLSAASADAFDDEDDSEFVDVNDVKTTTVAKESADDGFGGDDDPVPAIKPTSAPQPVAKASPKKVDSKSFDAIMDEMEETDGQVAQTETAPASGIGDAGDDELPF